MLKGLRLRVAGLEYSVEDVGNSVKSFGRGRVSVGLGCNYNV